MNFVRWKDSSTQELRNLFAKKEHLNFNEPKDMYRKYEDLFGSYSNQFNAHYKKVLSEFATGK